MIAAATKSARIRAMLREGVDVKDVAAAVGVSEAHVRVVRNPRSAESTKRWRHANGVNVPKPRKETS